jgi:hypothetical protein
MQNIYRCFVERGRLEARNKSDIARSSLLKLFWAIAAEAIHDWSGADCVLLRNACISGPKVELKL